MKKSKLLPFIGIFIFIFILSRIDYQLLVNQFRNINITYFLAGLGLLAPIVFLKGYKWGQILKIYNINYSPIKCTSAWMAGFSIGIITPGRIGDLMRAVYVKKDEDISLGIALISVIIDRILDLSMLILFAVAGTFYLASVYGQTLNLVLISVIIGVGFFVAIYIMSKKTLVKKLGKPIFKVLIPEKYAEKVKLNFNKFYHSIEEIKNKKFEVIKVFILTFIVWIFTFFQFYLFGRSLGLEITYIYTVFVMSIEQLSQILPISFGGIGTREAVMITFFGRIGINSSAIVGFSLLILFSMYIVGGIGALIFIKKSLKVKDIIT